MYTDIALQPELWGVAATIRRIGAAHAFADTCLHVNSTDSCVHPSNVLHALSNACVLQVRGRPLGGQASPALVNAYIYPDSTSAPVYKARYIDVTDLSAGAGYQVGISPLQHPPLLILYAHCSKV